MIERGTGNLLEADVEALVNTVNTVGVMGKGIALQFRNAYPSNFKAYAAACKRDEVIPGRMFVHDVGIMGPRRYIINFPTKRHWRGKSRLPDIEAGLVDLVRVLTQLDIKSVAVPPLGCGNGGLQWEVVEPLIRQALSALTDVQVLLYPPEGAPANDAMPIATRRPGMTGPRAAMLAVMQKYLLPEYRLTGLEAQKLAYFLQVAGLPMRLQHVKAQFGPYAENLNHALQALEGHYVRGYGDRSAGMGLYLLPGAATEAHDYLATDTTAAGAVEAVEQAVRGYETPYGLELLATVHWATVDLGSDDESLVVKYVQEWTERKGDIFTPHHVSRALAHLRQAGLVKSS